DFRFNAPQPGLATDYWFVHAHPRDPGGLTNPANWADELRLTKRSFDLERAPNTVRGLFVGDYEGLPTAGNSFLAFWAQPHRRDPANLFFRRIDECHHRTDGGDPVQEYVLRLIATHVGAPGGERAFAVLAGNSGVPERKHVGYLQDGHFSQVVDLASSSYEFGFDVPQRGIYPESNQPFPVRIDRSIAVTFIPSGIAPAAPRTYSFPVRPGARPVPLGGFNPDGGDDTALIDQIFRELV